MFGPLGMLGMERSLPETQDSDSEHLTENNEEDPQDQQLDLILDDANIAVEVRKCRNRRNDQNQQCRTIISEKSF